MARKQNRQLIGLECSQCHHHNYVTEKNIVRTKEKLVLNKYCKHCRRTTEHLEFKKLD